MKIFYVITKSNWGGAQKYVFDLAKNMKEEGREVEVVYGGHGMLAEKLEKEEIKGISIKNLGRDVNFFKEISIFFKLYKIFRKEKPDIIHLNSSKIGAIGSLVGRLAGIKKIIFTAHGFPFREDRKALQVLIIKFISWCTIIFSHKTICVSKKDFIDVENWPFIRNKLVIVHNGIDTDLKIEKRAEETRRVEVVSIGELHKNKGFKYALQTINKLKEKVQNFKYTVFSFGGDEKENLEKMINDLNLKDYVELIINKENHSEKLKDFDIYFMPSIKEGLPYVLLEASLNSLPMVASNTGGISEIVENNKNGFLVSPKSVEGFEEALLKLVEDKKLREDFGGEARKKVEENFSIQKMIEKTKEIYFT